MRRPMLAAFDFDNTFVDGDGLQTIVELGAGCKLPDVKANYKFSLDCLSVTESTIRDMQKSKGVTAQDIRKAIQALPLTKGLDDVLRMLKSHNCEVIIISDMMSVTIEDWMSVSPVLSFVDKVYTNPSHYDHEGYIVIKPYHVQDWCDKSFKSLCKGHVLEEHVKNKMAEGVSFDRVAYFGDGRNDFCPLLRLNENDLAFPRKGFRLWQLLETEARGEVRATVHPWCEGEDIIVILKNYLQSSD